MTRSMRLGTAGECREHLLSAEEDFGVSIGGRLQAK